MKNLSFSQVSSMGLMSLSGLLFGLAGYFWQTGIPPGLMLAGGVGIGVFLYVFLRGALPLIFQWLSCIPTWFSSMVLAFFGTAWMAKLSGFRLPDQMYYSGVILLLGVVLGISWFGLRLKSKFTLPAFLGLLLPLLLVSLGVNWLNGEGDDPYAGPVPDLKQMVSLANPLDGVPNPAEAGVFAVDAFTYGSGTDKHRPEFGAAVRHKTTSVDASLVLPDWKGKKKKWRERYWGFGVDNFPINGRVYMPKGEGPFPLALIVHGNHSMLDYSDDGYGYLGALLASHGIIAVSVDENFLNGHWSGDFQGKEMPARAWLLLQHLTQWRKWNAASDHALSGKADLDRVMLMGHSRGGEAVAIAAVFNGLSAFPDNALLDFDFNFGIRAVVALAPTDYRYARRMTMENVNYLTLQGSYDADETSFWGMRAYQRLQFTDGGDYFKAGVYIHRGNHGQFNNTWGRKDFGPPYSWLLNTAPLIPSLDQQRVAQVFVSAFAHATLLNDPTYIPLFDAPAYGHEWLPDNFYLTRHATSGDSLIQDFEEDLDPSKGLRGLTNAASGFRSWREEKLQTRDKGAQENQAVMLGWDYDNRIPPLDSLAVYHWHFSEALRLDTSQALLLTLGSGDEKTNAPDPILRLTDTTGLQAVLRLSDVQKIPPPLLSRFLKRPKLSEERLGKDWEVQLQDFVLPMDRFSAPTNFNPNAIQSISLMLDRDTSGVLVVDNLGLRKIAYTKS